MFRIPTKYRSQINKSVFSPRLQTKLVLLRTPHSHLRPLSSKPTTNSTETSNKPPPSQPTSSIPWLPRFMTKEHIVADIDYNRWKALGVAIPTNVGLGTLLAWSIFNRPMTTVTGVVASSSTDWGLTEVTPSFGACCLTMGLTASFLGNWIQKAGARTACTLSALCFSGGLGLGAIGVAMHSLPLMYLGTGVGCGMGMGFGYPIPLQYLMFWFPDKRGLVSGLATTAFAGGAVLTPPVARYFLNKNFIAPEYLGPASEVELITQEGVRFANVGGELKEVVVANLSDISRLHQDLTEGVYLVGTGSTGLEETWCVMGLGCGAMLLAASFGYRLPAPGWTPKRMAIKRIFDEFDLNNDGFIQLNELQKGIKRSSNRAMNKLELLSLASGVTGRSKLDIDQFVELVSQNPSVIKGWDLPKAAPGAVSLDVSRNESLKTPQFWGFAGVMFCSPIPGFVILANAATMMSEIYGSALPHIVSPYFTTMFVSACALGNLSGRLFFGPMSDKIGYKNCFNIYLAGNVGLCLVIPFATNMVVASPNGGVISLGIFYSSAFMLNAFYGGLWAVSVPYLSHVFGPKHVTSIYGTTFLGSSVSLLLAPVMASNLRRWSEKQSIGTLAETVDPTKFQQAFEAPVKELPALIEANTTTIPRLMELMPPGTLDPSPLLYNSAMYTSAAICAIGLFSNATIKDFTQKQLKLIYAKREAEKLEEEEEDT